MAGRPAPVITNASASAAAADASAGVTTTTLPPEEGGVEELDLNTSESAQALFKAEFDAAEGQGEGGEAEGEGLAGNGGGRRKIMVPPSTGDDDDEGADATQALAYGAILRFVATLEKQYLVATKHAFDRWHWETVRGQLGEGEAAREAAGGWLRCGGVLSGVLSLGRNVGW